MSCTELRRFDTWTLSKPANFRRLDKCPCCWDTHHSLWYTNKDLTLYRCRNCEVIYQDPQPDLTALLHQSYDQEYFDSCDQLLSAQTKALKARLESIWESIKHDGNIQKPPHLLDVGSGIGAFLTVAKQQGWKPVGLEPSSYATQYCVEKLGLHVIQGSLDDNISFSNTFDVVTLNHVLEHFQNPVENLQRLRSLMRPGGLLAVEVPREGRLASIALHYLSTLRTATRYPRPSFTIVHMCIFTPRSLRTLLGRCGFTVERMWIEGNAASPERFQERFGDSPFLGKLLGRASQMWNADVLAGLGNIVVYARSLKK